MDINLCFRRSSNKLNSYIIHEYVHRCRSNPITKHLNLQCGFLLNSNSLATVHARGRKVFKIFYYYGDATNKNTKVGPKIAYRNLKKSSKNVAMD